MPDARRWFALVVLTVLVITGIAGAQTRGGTLRFMLILDAAGGIDPHKTTEATAQVMLEQMYDTLVEADPETGAIIPSLAESWQISADGRTYTFRIRRGVRFHNGREMTAADVKYSIERIMDPRTGSPRRLSFNLVERVDASDAQTVVFRLKTAFAPFLATLVPITSAIVPREAVEQSGDLARTAVGTGPFVLKEWVRDSLMRLERNANFWRRGLPNLDTLEFRFNADPNARTAAFRTGQVNFLYKVDKPFVRTLRLSEGIQVVGGQSTTLAYLYLNVNRKPFDDVRVRQAISWAMDRDAIRQNAILGLGQSLRAGPLPPDHWAALREPVYPRQEVDRARDLLRQAGFTGGRFNILAVSITPSNVRAAETLQQQLRPLGFDIEVRVLEPGEMLRSAFAADFDMLILHDAFAVDPDDYLTSTFATGGGRNWVKYSDPELDAMLERARTITDRGDRARIYRDVMRRLAVQGPKAFLYLEADFHAFPRTLRGFRFDPTNSFRSLREVWFER